MNIMKTNMLLLDNKFMKDDADTTVAAPIPSESKPEAGMKALTFEGLKNLMANPGLAKEAGVTNNTPMAKEAGAYVAPYSSNIAFQGAAQTAGKAAIAALLTLGAAAGLTSCEDKITQEVKVEVDLSSFMEMMSQMYNLLSQMLNQQKLNYDQFQQLLAQLNAWQAQSSADSEKLYALLESMGNQIFGMRQDMNKGFDENNSYHQLVLSYLSQYMTRDEAVSLFNSLCSKIDAGQLSVEQAMEEIIKQLKNVNQKLDTIIANQEKAYEELKAQTEILRGIKGDTKEAKEAAKLANQQLTTINNTIIDGDNKIVGAISKLDGDMNAGFYKTAQTIGCSTTQLANIIKKTGLDIQRTDTWNSMMVTAAINYNTHVTEKGNKELAALRADFNAGRLTAEQYAQKMLEAIESIDAKVGTLITDFNSYANDMRTASKTAIAELKKGNKTASEIKNLTKTVISNQQKAYAMLNVMNQNIEKVDIDMNANAQALAKQLGCTYADLKATLMWLGFTEAQISKMNTSAIINAIKTSSNKEIAVIGGKLNTIIEKLDKGSISENEAINQIVSLLENIDKNVAEIKDTLKDLSANFSQFYSEYKNDQKAARSLLCQILNQNRIQTNILASQNQKLASMDARLKELTNITNNIYAATQDNTKFNALMAELKQIKANGGVDYNKLQEMFNAMGITIEKAMSMNASQLASAIKNFQNTYIATEQKEINLQVANNKKLDYIACLIKSKTSDNADVIAAINNVTNAVNKGNTNINKELEALGTKLDALIKAVNQNLDKMNTVITTMKTYGDKIINTYVAGNNDILAAIKANGNKIDVTNKTLAELKAEVAKIKPDLQKLVSNTTLSNSYLKTISEKAVDIDNSIKNLNNIAGGKGITAEELEALWQQHDAAAYAKAKALANELHAENILKLNEVIEYLKKGNQIALDTYNVVVNFANKANLNAEEYKKLLKAIYEYLPKLICDCKCKADCDNNDNVHEGIIELLG